ncbi:hypothetical protein EIP91_009598, partial [Steccherinum ochraceum]
MPRPRRRRRGTANPKNPPPVFPTPGPGRHKVMLELDSPRRQYKPPIKCHNCQKPQQEGTSLYHCQGCRIYIYCGSECQKADWPKHKAECQRVHQLQDERPETATHHKGLLSHFSVLEDVLASYGPYALNLHNNPSARRDRVLRLDVISVPGTHEGWGGSYVVVDVRSTSILEYTEDTREFIQCDMADFQQEYSEGDIGVFFISIIFPNCSFVKAVRYFTHLPCDVEVAWKERLIQELND